MNEIKIKVHDSDRSQECIICMEDISENLLDNEYCDCNFKYHEKCYEKWLAYNNIITINMERNNDYVDYRCILCKERILFDVKINEWMDETSEKFKELNNMRDMTDIMIRNVILEQRERIRRTRELSRIRRCCICEKYNNPFLINITCCYNVTIWNGNDVRVIVAIIVSMLLLGAFVTLVSLISDSGMV